LGPPVVAPGAGGQIGVNPGGTRSAPVPPKKPPKWKPGAAY